MPATDGKMTWDAEADRKLLLTILKNQEIKVDTVGASKELGCTPIAIKNRISRLKSMVKAKDEEDGKDDDASNTNGATQNNGNAAPIKPRKASKANSLVPKTKAAPPVKKQKTANGTSKARGRPPKSAQKIATPDTSDDGAMIKSEPKINFGGTHFTPVNEPTNKRKRSDVDEESASEDFNGKVKAEEESYEDGFQNADSVFEET
ncbi:MAG: hypothetical protein LQ342_006305 [Letrouitia transgressa]|nr:MAG: hypothetical protein LQ342_006305 [Letrouitia transgressa]